jgi:uncharacterized membrane protein
MTLHNKSEQESDGKKTFRNYLILMILGFLIAFVGIIVMLIAIMLSGNTQASFGIVIFIGPFPIVIGAGSQITWLILFALILAFLSIAIFFMTRRQEQKKEL